MAKLSKVEREKKQRKIADLNEKMMAKTSAINTWKPKKDQILVEEDNKIFICHFDKIYNKPKLAVYNRFKIDKSSYVHQLPTIVKYINFFMNIYDTDDELVLAYFKIKSTLDKHKRFGKDDITAYINYIYELLFTNTMVDKIERMVEENYLDNIEMEDEEKKNYQKNDKKHLESLEFTNEQIKILLRISFAMKIMCPVIFHYLFKNVIKVPKDSDILYQFYKRLFTIFGTGSEWEMFNESGEFINKVEASIVENRIKNNELVVDNVNDERLYYDNQGNYYKRELINMYNKLFIYIKTKVLESDSNNALIFSQREIMGVDLFSVMRHFIRIVLISDNMVKYKFNEEWDPKQMKYKESVIGFNKTIVKCQLNYFIRYQFKKNVTEVTNSSAPEGLSGVDKMAMNLTKIDEGQLFFIDMNIKTTIDYVKRKFGVTITDIEVNYYRKHLVPSDIQIMLIYVYYARFFGSYRDLKLLRRRDYITLALILKKKLLKELGFENPDKTNEIYMSALPYILTGNLVDKVNTRMIRNQNFIQKVEDDQSFQILMANVYNALNEIEPECVKVLLSKLINTKFDYITPEKPEFTGTEILYSEDMIASESVYFLNSSHSRVAF